MGKMIMTKAKKALTCLIKNQSGQGALVMVLVLLVVGTLIIGMLLAYMGTGLKAGQMHEEKTLGYYAADSGIEDARWELGLQTPPHFQGEPPSSWELGEEVNGMSVSLEWLSVSSPSEGGTLYTVKSTATLDGENKSEVVAEIMQTYSFDYLLDNAISSPNDVTIMPGSVVTGDVQYNGDLDNKGTIDGNEITDPIEDWPTAEEMAAFYWEDVKDLDPPFPYEHPMDIDATDTTIEAFYRDGPLDIYNSSNTPATLTLNGTVYVTGDLTIGKTGKPFTLDLNGQSIFVESSSADPQKAIWVGDKCTIIGSGCIIAVGDIYFAPDGDVGSEEDFVFIMSVDGIINFQPIGDFYGAVAGDIEVTLQPGCTLTHTEYGGGLEFPTGDPKTEITKYNIE